MRKKENIITKVSQHVIIFTMLICVSVVSYTQCNTTVWQGRSQSTMPVCFGNWVDAGAFVHNGVMQTMANQTCNPQYYYPEYRMTDSLCITSNFTYEIRLRNLNPTPPLNLSAYDVVLKILNTSGISTGVTLMDANPAYDWSQVYTSLYAGSSSVGNLSSLRPDLNIWQTVTLKYQDNTLTCLLNGIQAAQISYTGTITMISGLNVLFKGSGEVDWIRFLDANNTEVWREDFYNAQTPGCFTPFPDPGNTTITPGYTAPTCGSNVLSLFSNANPSLSNVSWSGPAGFTSTQQNPVINTPTTANNGTYTVTGQLGGCGPTVTGSVDVNITPVSVLWEGRSQSTTPVCFSNWVDAGAFVHNGAMQTMANQTCNPLYYYPEYRMTDSLCITPDFTYEIKLRNLNPTPPLNLSAYDVYLKVLNTSGISTGVTLMDSNPAYDWSQIYTTLFAGSSSVGNLSSLRPDLNNWTTVSLKYQNNVLTCLINGIQAAQVPYTGSICTISGLNVMFKGSGEVDWIRILDANNTEVWREDFYNAQSSGCFTPFPDCTDVALSPSYAAPTCADNVLSLFSNVSQSFPNVSWSGPAGFTSTQQNPVIINPTTANNGTYTVTGQMGGCGPVRTGSIVANFSPPSITSNIPDVTINTGDSVQLIAIGGSSYSWTPNINISSTVAADPWVWPITDTKYIVTITEGSCVAVDSILVKVLKPLVIPNIFSPNGDGIHDRWEIENLARYSGCIVQIFNRYGQMVQRFVNYTNPWDGKINGRDAPIGTYYYIIDPKNGTKPFAGFVDIIR